MQTITEGTATITAPVPKIATKKVDVFYNPIMKVNRDFTIAVINAWKKKDIQAADVFAASGIRAIRLLKETKKVKRIVINDYDPKAIENIKHNLKQNKIKESENVVLSQKDADIFLLESNGFDFIDLDPFGTPVPFLDAACKRLSRDSILAVTATDTSALAGTYPRVCKRNYDATPLLCPQMHEIGLRILIRKCQVVAAQYERALTPIFSYFKDHYMRVFFRCEKGKQKADAIMKQHKTVFIKSKVVGPLWTGAFWDPAFIKKMKTKEPEAQKFLEQIKEEMNIDTVLFHDIHALCKELKCKVPKFEILFKKIKQKKHAAARTHFTHNGIRSPISKEELIEIIKQI